MATPTDRNTLGELVVRMIERDGWRAFCEAVLPSNFRWPEPRRSPDCQGVVYFASTPPEPTPPPEYEPLRITPSRWVTERLEFVQAAREEPMQARMLELSHGAGAARLRQQQEENARRTQERIARVERIHRMRAAERDFTALRRDVETRTGYVQPKPLPAGHTVIELDAPRERFLEQLRRLEAEIRSGQVYA